MEHDRVRDLAGVVTTAPTGPSPERTQINARLEAHFCGGPAYGSCEAAADIQWLLDRIDALTAELTAVQENIAVLRRYAGYESAEAMLSLAARIVELEARWARIVELR